MGYFGDLAELLDAAARALRPAGHLVLTVERSDAPDAQPYTLELHGCQVHSLAYVKERRLAASVEVAAPTPEVLRLERGQPVQGLLAVARAAAI